MLRIALAALWTIILAACGGGSSAPDTALRTLTVDQLHPGIARIYADPLVGAMCKAPQACNGAVRVNCGMEVDGPQNYYRESDGQLLMKCGGACMAPAQSDPLACKACPPSQWTCQP